MDNYLDGKVALITGGYTGIGLAICRELVKHGAGIAIGSRKPDQSIADEFTSQNAKFFATRLDIRETKNINDCLVQIKQQLGPVDILINAAGISASQTVSGHSDELWDDIIDTNLSGPFKLTRACLPGMIKRKWGRIINIGSTAVRTAMADSPAYCASKSGLLGLTRAVALEGAAHGVSCIMISPTWVETPMMQRSMEELARQNNTSAQAQFSKLTAQSPQKRLVQADEIAALVGFVCRQEANGITMEDIQVNAGNLW